MRPEPFAFQVVSKNTPLSHVLCTATFDKPVPADGIEPGRSTTGGFADDSDRIDHQVFG